MLLKTPGLTVVGVLGIAVGTAVGVGFFVVLSGFLHPELPLEEGDRIVALQHWNVETSEPVRASQDDFLRWRGEVRSLEQLAAASMRTRSLVTGEAPPRPVRAAEMTATGFQVARVQPLLGRHLLPEDDVESSPRVAVLSHDLWQRDFDGDAGVLGRPILVGSVQHIVVGVMPPGFAVPKNQELWTALPARATGHQGDAGPELFVFGRLAPGATREEARTELVTIDRRAALDSPDQRHLLPQLLSYTHPLDDIQVGTLWHAARIQLMVSLLLVAVALNVAVLVYARTAMRRGEIALRAALGARRPRIVAQLFVEALLLSSAGASLGLALARVGLGHFEAFMGRLDGAGFWVSYDLQPRSVGFALLLAVLSAVIIGVLPALKSTGGMLEADLRRLGSGASARLGWAWTAMIVAQVAVAVTVLPTAVHLGFQEVRMGAVRATFPADGFLTAELGLAVPLRAGMDADAHRAETAARFAARLPEVERRLEADPAIAGVTFEGHIPNRASLVEIQGVAGPAAFGAHAVPARGVALDYFDLLGARVLAGRELRAADLEEPGGGVVVNEAFVRRVLDGVSPLGLRLRFIAGSEVEGEGGRPVAGPWLDVVGVVENLQASAFDRTWAVPTMYRPVAPEKLQSAHLLVRVRSGDPESFAPRLHRITADLDPDFRLGSVENLASSLTPHYFVLAVTVVLLLLATVLLLSAAGIHALMSLAVTRRRKEIAIRVALGARARRLLPSIFARAAWQLGLGGVLGSLFGGALLLGSGVSAWSAGLFLGLVVSLMLAAGLAATVGPARRGLAVQPMDALKED